MRNLMQRLELGIDELILGFLILIEVLDFFTVIPAPLEYVEKAVAVAAICYLFYKASLTRIIFGLKEKKYDLMIVLGFFLLSLKTIVGFLMSAVREESAMQELYSFVLARADLIEKMGFWIGGGLLMVAAVLLVHEKIKNPCVMGIIHEDAIATGLWRKIIRFFSIYLVLLAVFVTVFTFTLEWLGLTVDAPVLMIILFFYLFVIVKRGRGMKTESFLKRVSESSEKFYGRFVSLFHSRRTIMTAITGLLVLHLLVDIGHFIIPYTTGLLYPWYFRQMGAGHLPLAEMMARDFTLASGWLMQLGVMLTYILNVLAMLMLFFGPAYAWVYLYKRKKVRIMNIMWLFFGSLAVFIMQPVFRIGQMTSPSLIGVDITTQQIPVLENVGNALLVAALVMGIFYILGRKDIRRTARVGFFAIFAYFGLYLYHFFFDIAKYYVGAVVMMTKAGQYFISAHLLLFFMITIMFYVAGYLMFLWQLYAKQKI
jgi:hypothetical protein